jgi:hypothetical protein
MSRDRRRVEATVKAQIKELYLTMVKCMCRKSEGLKFRKKGLWVASGCD